MKINLLAFAAHPDDVELSCAGTLITHQMRGFTTGVIDFTRGELGTRGTAEGRLAESEAAAEILGLSVRENLEFEDGFFVNDKAHQLKVIAAIRAYQPDIVITNAIYDRHPDHGRAAELVQEAFFKAGLQKVETIGKDGKPQQPWRPRKLYHMIQSVATEPDVLVDVSDAHERKMEAIRAYKSQFFDPKSKEPQTYISKPEFIQMIEARGLELGHRIGVKYAEGFTTRHPIGVKELYHLV